MAEEVGAIRYTTEVDTSDLLTAEKQVDKVTNEIVKDFDKIDGATKKTTNEIKKTTKAVDAALTAQSRAAERTARTTERAAERKAKSTERAAERASVAAEKAAAREISAAEKSAASTARAAEKASSKEIVAAERTARETASAAKKAAQAKAAAADRASKATVAAQRRSAIAEQKRIGGFGRASGQAGIQFQQFIGQVQGGQSVMLALSQQSADLGFVLGAPLLGAVVGISASLAGMFLPSLFKATEGVIDLDDAIEKLTKEFDDLTKAQQKTTRNVIVERIKEQRKEYNGLAKEINEVQSKLIIAEQQQGGRLLERVFGADPEKLRAELAKLKGSLVVAGIEIKKNEDKLKDLGGETKKYKETLSTIISGIKSQTIALLDGEEASFRFATAQQLNLKAGEMLPANIDAQITALFKLKAAQDEIAKAKTAGKRATSFAAGVIKRGLSPEDKLQADLDQLIRDQALISITEFELAETAIVDQQSKLREGRRLAEAKSAANAQKIMQSAVLGFVSATTGALMAGMDEQSSAYKALFFIQKGVAIASTIINAQVASIAALAPPPIGLGPIAGLALSNTILGLGFASAGIIAGTAISGGRQFGGPVTAGDAFRVGEAGPEIFTAGGKNFMIPGENGKVIANDDIGGGGFIQNVTIENYGNDKVTTQTSDDGKHMRIAVNEVARQISTGQGIVSKALKSSTTARFKATS
jgi:hypothetical protein